MIEELLPDSVVAVEAHGDEEAEQGPLYPEEAAVVARAVDKRRREFTAVRTCARRAMVRLGIAPRAVVPGERGAPAWPDGIVGSMTHCDGYRAAALARATDLLGLGIDAEPHGPLPDGVLGTVTLPDEAGRLRTLAENRPALHGDRVLFSAKESVYKAWFPLTGAWLDFTEADVEIRVADESTDASPHGDFRARLLVPGPWVNGRRLGHFDGRWAVRRGLVITTVAVGHGS